MRKRSSSIRADTLPQVAWISRRSTRCWPYSITARRRARSGTSAVPAGTGASPAAAWRAGREYFCRYTRCSSAHSGPARVRRPPSAGESMAAMHIFSIRIAAAISSPVNRPVTTKPRPRIRQAGAPPGASRHRTRGPNIWAMSSVQARRGFPPAAYAPEKRPAVNTAMGAATAANRVPSASFPSASSTRRSGPSPSMASDRLSNSPRAVSWERMDSNTS